MNTPQLRKIWNVAPVLTLLAITALHSTGCSYRHAKDGSNLGSGNPNGTDTSRTGAKTGETPTNGVGFAQIKTQILEPKCTRCHSNYASYSNVFADREDIRQAVLIERSMPKRDTMSDEQYATLQEWLDAGAPEVAPVAPPAPEPVPVPVPAPATSPSPAPQPEPQPVVPPATELPATWSNVQSQLLVPNCVKCHGDGDEMDLNDLDTVKAKASRILDLVLVKQKMPPSAASYLRVSEDSKLLFVRWVSAKMPNP
jgi:hypothetical protein